MGVRVQMHGLYMERQGHLLQVQLHFKDFHFSSQNCILSIHLLQTTDFLHVHTHVQACVLVFSQAYSQGNIFTHTHKYLYTFHV